MMIQAYSSALASLATVLLLSSSLQNHPPQKEKFG
jgi:hypothetical protein